jgi:hypothetical protein
MTNSSVLPAGPKGKMRTKPQKEGEHINCSRTGLLVSRRSTGKAFPTGSRNEADPASIEIASCVLLQGRRLLFANARQSLLNPAREFLLPGELDLRVFLGHPDRAVAGDF